MHRIYHRLLLLLLPALLSLAACRSPVEQDASTQAPTSNPAIRDFSGHWEKNFQMSDDFGTRISLFIADIQRRYNPAPGRGDINLGGAVPVSAAAINGLARFAEELTRMPLLDIRQEELGIRIERENDFPLRCNWRDFQAERSSTVYGVDACGWSGERLLFSMNLQGGLGIMHQLSLSPDGELLDITTTVSSSMVAAPLVIRNVYRRYQPPEEDYTCILTLTRSRVCSQRGTPR